MSLHPFPKNLAGRNVLVVEDESVIAKALVWIFELCGARIVGPAPTIEQAMKLIRETERLDGAVLDINLHGEYSYDIADALNERGVPFVLNTAYNRKELPFKFRNVPHCQKPVKPGEIIAALFPEPAK